MEGGRFWVAMGGKWSEQMHGRFAWLWVEDWWKNELNRALLLIMGLFFIFFWQRPSVNKKFIESFIFTMLPIFISTSMDLARCAYNILK